ncbi:MAG: zinc ribbon domain-containing protein [Magnetococcales bacterium]|nr:zinc ribbon domain-containing protein [Magnetococcales bacterium]
MPIYDYKCDPCNHRFEHNHAMAENPVVVCPQCGSSQQVRKILSTGGIMEGKSGGASNFSPPPAMSGCPSGGCGMGGGMCGMSG